MFYNIDKRILYAVIAMIVITEIPTFLSNPNLLLALLISIPGILIAITFHEFAHAKVADKLGDDTPRIEGRLTLNPLDHIEPVGFIMLVFAGFGWGKPVHVNPRNYNRDISMEKADSLVSIAGPVTNFILAIIFTILYLLMNKYIKNPAKIISIIMGMINSTIIVNIGLGVFNLIPLPPLDGSKVIKPFLPYNAKVWFENNERIFYFVFIILWIIETLPWNIRIIGSIISPIINLIYTALMNLGSFII